MGEARFAVGGRVCLGSPPSKARLGFSKGSGPAVFWGGNLTMLPIPVVGLAVFLRPIGPVMPCAHSGSAAFWILHIPFTTKCDKNVLYKE